MKLTEPLTEQGLFKDKHGNVVLGQMPNVLFWGWLACKILGYVIPNKTVDHWLAVLAVALLASWALLELTSGVNYFRRIVGMVVLLLVVANIFW